MVDCYMSWNAAVSLEMAHRLATFNIYWFEDLLTPDHLDALAGLREQIHPVLLAGGAYAGAWKLTTASTNLPGLATPPVWP